MKGFAQIYLLKDENGNTNGYGVRICQKGESSFICIDEYTAGDSESDSQVYGTGEIETERLLEWARQTAQEMMEENDLIGPIEETDE